MKKTSAFLNLVVAFSMILAMVAVHPSAVRAQQDPPPAPQDDVALGNVLAQLDKAEAANPIDKIDPRLREAAEKRGSEEVAIYVSVRRNVNLSKFMSFAKARPEILPGLHNIYGLTTADKLLSIAAEPGVIAVVSTAVEEGEKPYDPERENTPLVDPAARLTRLQQLRQNEVPFAQAQAQGIGASGWFDVLDGHKSKDAWKKGFTGQGVIVGVLDDGIDFGHPDLQGTYARVLDSESPYYGWPMAYSETSYYYYYYDVYTGSHLIENGSSASRWSDTQTTIHVGTCFGCPSGKASFKPLGAAEAHEYTVPATSQSGNYKFGSHNDKNLLATYNERVAVLVVDENEAGVYDTVYVDLDNDYDFTDEKPVTKDSPEIYRDLDGDGYADISGGLLVWIADGDNLPPTADWLWDISCGDEVGSLKACADAGELVIFTGAFEEGYTHGTQCASNIVGQGVVSGGASAPSFHIGGMVQGAAPDVKVMDFSNHYYTPSDEDEYLVAALGYDGVVDSGDEAQITSNSYGSFTQMWGGWGYIGRLITLINLTVGPNTMYVFSGGNEGPGYGPQEGEGGPTIIKAGTSTQFGSTNWDSIAGIDQIVYGDPSSFGSKGPNRDGSAGLDILGNGGRGAGDSGLNQGGFNGATSWDTWGGTSRSGPVVAGNLALLYQAFKERNGRWPTWDEVMPIVKSSATNSVSSPFLQGAGVINSDRSTDVAAGIYGVYATPDEWQVGDWQGKQYLNFAKVASPGSTFTQTYTVKNPSGYPITVGLQDGYMQRMSEKEYTFTTSDQSLESAFNFHSPDYLMALDPATIPADAELMVVRYTQPYTSYDPNLDYTTADNSWRYMLYNWTDINGDGKLWEDKNNNGTVNHVDSTVVDNDTFHQVDYTDPGTEIQQGEYIRMDYEFGGTAIPLFIHDPLARMGNGYFFGFQHRANNHTVDKTTFKIRVEFYKRADWPWLSLSKTSLAVPANGQATFVASAAIPADAKTGDYEGVIYMTDPGDQYHPAHESALPVVVNVIADLPDGDTGAFALGNAAQRADTLYQNSYTNGYFNWYGGGWTGAGDWRHYFFNVDQNDVAKDNLLVHTYWEDAKPTDINTFVLGPTNDCASNGANPCAWYGKMLGQPDQDVYGPYTLQPIAQSTPFRAGAAYPFETNGGDTNDWLLAGMKNPGLHEIALFNTLFSGKNIDAKFGVDVGTLSVTPRMADANTGYVLETPLTSVRTYTDTGKVNLWFKPSIQIPDLKATLQGDLKVDQTPTESIMVPDNAADGPFTPGNVVRLINVTVPGTTQLVAHVIMPVGTDVDLWVMRDVNNNGTLDAGDTVAGSSTKSAGNDDVVTLNNPVLGKYLAVLGGYDSNSPVGYWSSVTYPSGVPTEENYAYDNNISVPQGQPFAPTTGVSVTFTTTVRTHALHAYLTVPAGNDLDLYLMDSNGEVVVTSTTDGDESIDVYPPAGEYRFPAGQKYTLWVYGYDVPTSPVSAYLQLWSDDLNVWLDEPAHPDVHVSAIAAGTPVSLTLEYAKSAWAVGQQFQVRLVAGPTPLPTALSRSVNFLKVDKAAIPPADTNVSVTETIISPRAPTYSPAINYGTFLADAAAIAPDDEVLFKFTVKNTGFLTSKYKVQSNWRDDTDVVGGKAEFKWVGFVGTAPAGYTIDQNAPACSANNRTCVNFTVELTPGQAVTYQIKLKATADILSYPFATPYFLEHTRVFWTDGTTTSGERAVAGAAGWLDGAADLPYDLPYLSYKEAPETVVPGATFQYKIHLSNPSAEVQPLFVSDTLPEEVTFVSVTAPVTGTLAYDAATKAVTWSGNLPVAGIDLVFTVKASADLKDGDAIYNEASVAYKYLGDPFAWFDATTFVDDNKSPDLVVTKTVDKLNNATGQVLAYTITLKNNGNETATKAYVEDVLPKYFVLDKATLAASAGTATFDGEAVVWKGDLAAGATVTITFNGAIDPTASTGNVLLNAATAGSDNYQDTAYSSAVTEVVKPLSFTLMLPVVHK